MENRLEDTFQNNHWVTPGYCQSYADFDSVLQDMRGDLNVSQDGTERHYLRYSLYSMSDVVCISHNFHLVFFCLSNP
jgi:hypothetical protein